MSTSLTKILLQKTVIAEFIKRQAHTCFFKNVFPLNGAYQPLSRENLQELDEHPPISEVGIQVCDSAGHSGKVGVDPLGECLLLYGFTLICKQKRTYFTTNPALATAGASQQSPTAHTARVRQQK